MIKKILKGILKILLAFVIIMLIWGAIKQNNYNSKVFKEHQPIGKFVDIGTNKVHYDYFGEGDITFVLIAGLGETMHTWSRIREELAGKGRVFMYDRSGLGHSEEGVLPRSVDNIANELNTALEKENIPGPYVIIGHSAGGFSARYYAKKYPENIKGLFIIDPYQEMGKEEFGEWPFSYKATNWLFRNMSWSGIPFALLPDPPHPTYKTSKAIKTYGYEAFAEDISLKQFAELDEKKSELPLYIITADKPNNKHNELFQKWNQEISEKYTHEISKHLIIESGHHIHVEKPEVILDELDEFISRLND
ncbi:alpha/beta fold hydrolase [Winogradskyella sp. 3972H.M.0a.05]|uniref:alpha/beta fold hydrolase n=1 Tax=Winogradskyella sp. 3972H.M.0a.05 TaxID=2950277 RepID=UPI00339A389F